MAAEVYIYPFLAVGRCRAFVRRRDDGGGSRFHWVIHSIADLIMLPRRGALVMGCWYVWAAGGSKGHGISKVRRLMCISRCLPNSAILSGSWDHPHLEIVWKTCSCCRTGAVGVISPRISPGPRKSWQLGAREWEDGLEFSAPPPEFPAAVCRMDSRMDMRVAATSGCVWIDSPRRETKALFGAKRRASAGPRGEE